MVFCLNLYKGILSEILASFIVALSIWDGLLNGIFKSLEHTTRYEEIYLHEVRINSGTVTILICFAYWWRF